jgi:type IV secretory pathway VirB2 component (pilin)
LRITKRITCRITFTTAFTLATAFAFTLEAGPAAAWLLKTDDAIQHLTEQVTGSVTKKVAEPFLFNQINLHNIRGERK